jgi:hypothetical protein
MALSPAAPPLHQPEGHSAFNGRCLRPGFACRTALGFATVASVCIALLGPAAGPARAQTPSPNQPEAIGPSTEPLKRCPRLPPTAESNLQPLQLKPEQVPGKNAMGCLSAADAIYGPDGCPVRRCTRAESLRRMQFPLPAATGP